MGAPHGTLAMIFVITDSSPEPVMIQDFRAPMSYGAGEESEQVLPRDQACWPAVDQDHRGPGLLERLDRAADPFTGADHGQRRRHVPADRVLRVRPAGDQRVEQVTLD